MEVAVTIWVASAVTLHYQEVDMSMGLVVGYVYTPDGKPIGDAQVTLLSVKGSAAGSEIAITGEKNTYLRSPITDTNSDGSYVLAFSWSGADIGEAIGTSGKLQLSMVASKEIGSSHSSTDYLDRRTLTGFLVKDTLGAGGLTTSAFQSLPDLLDFAKHLLEAYRKVRSHPLFSTKILSSESWLILSGGNFWIRW